MSHAARFEREFGRDSTLTAQILGTAGADGKREVMETEWPDAPGATWKKCSRMRGSQRQR